MKRMHVSLKVNDLSTSVAFYSALFGSNPTVLKQDYAKWMLDDPRVNFAIGLAGEATGVAHLGIQVETQTELDELYARVEQADGPKLDQGEVECCYARSTKQWISDPQGVSWEAFLTHGDAQQYGADRAEAARPEDEATEPLRCC